MGWEERQKQLLALSYHELQTLCKQYELPANKSHSQLASSLATLLENSVSNSVAERKKASGSTQASLVASSALLPNTKEAPIRCQDNHKRGPYSDRDDGVRPLLHAKHHKGPQTPMDETPRSDFETRAQIGDGIGNNSTTQEPAIELDSTTMVEDKIVMEPSYPSPTVGENAIDNGNGSSDKISKKATSFEFFVMSDEGIDLFVDLNSTPSTLFNSFKEELCIPPTDHHSEPGISNFISSLKGKDDRNSITPSGNITVGTQNKGAGSTAPCTNSSLGSTAGENVLLEPHLPDTSAVDSMSSASTLSGTPLEISGLQERIPVVSSCLTSDVQYNMSSDMTARSLDDKLLPQQSVDVSMRTERNHAPIADDSVQPTGDLVSSDSDENYCPKSQGKQETINVPGGALLTHNGGDTHELLLENERVEAVPVDDDIACGDRLSFSCQLASQKVAKLPVDAQSDASSAERHVAGNLNFTNPTPSSAASDNAINTNHRAESYQSPDSADKTRCDSEELEGLESKTEPPTRNIRLSLRSASARQAKSATSRRRSARLVPK